MGQEMPPKLPLPLGGIQATMYYLRGSLDQVHTCKRISTGSAVLAQLMVVTNGQTERHTDNATYVAISWHQMH